MPTTTGIATEFIQFTRTSNATVTDSDGLVKWAPHNLLTNSESFDAWSKNVATVAANAIAAPNGTTTADTITSTGSGSYVLQAYSAISGTVTVSVFAKPGTNSSVVLRSAQAGNGYETSFTLSGSGTAGTPTIVGTGGTVSGMTAAISSLANSWYLCSITFAETGLGNVFILQSATSGTIHLWGASLYRSDLGGMQPNTSAYPMYNPTTPKNLLGFTEDFSSAAWVKSGAPVTANSAIAPNGLQTADTISAIGGSAAYVYQSMPNTSGPHTVSIYGKAGTKSFIQFSTNSFTWGVDARANFDLSAGVLGTVDASLTATITPIGNGWYRCAVTRNKEATAGVVVWCIIDGPTSTREAPTTAGTLYLWGAQLSDSASLDAYSPVYGAAVTSAAYYGPRRDFDGATLACKGLLVEEQRSNSLLYSSAFSDAYWTKQTVTLGTPGVAPDGTTTASLLIPSNTPNVQQLFRLAVVASSTCASSIYAKANGINTFEILDGASGTNGGSFNLSTGVATNKGTGVASMVPVGNGWYRCVSVATTTGFRLYCPNSTGTASGDGTSGIYIWGAQLEAGSFATSYIPVGSTTAGATRNADVASVSTQAFPYSATEGTLVANGSFRSLNLATTNGFAALGDGTANNNIGIFKIGVNVVASEVLSSGSSQAVWTVSNSTQPFKAAIAYQANNTNFAVAGTAQTADTTITIPTVNTLYLGTLYSGTSNPMNGWIRQITYLPRRISNTELQTRTA